MEKPDQIGYLAELQNSAIGEVQKDVGDDGACCQWEQGDPNALRTLPCAHGSSLLRKDAGRFGLLKCREHGISAVFFSEKRISFAQEMFQLRLTQIILFYRAYSLQRLYLKWDY